MKDIKGYVHSFQSLGALDGPGVRYTVFLAGCNLRCSCCHNPDTWELKKGTEMTADELIALYMKNKAFYTKGGITVTGGEPLLQADFILNLFKELKKFNSRKR